MLRAVLRSQEEHPAVGRCPQLVRPRIPLGDEVEPLLGDRLLPPLVSGNMNKKNWYISSTKLKLLLVIKFSSLKRYLHHVLAQWPLTLNNRKWGLWCRDTAAAPLICLAARSLPGARPARYPRPGREHPDASWLPPESVDGSAPILRTFFFCCVCNQI